MGTGRAILERISDCQSPDAYHHEHWQGTFDEYLDIVRQKSEVARTAYQRLYDMVTRISQIETKIGWFRNRVEPIK